MQSTLLRLACHPDTASIPYLLNMSKTAMGSHGVCLALYAEPQSTKCCGTLLEERQNSLGSAVPAAACQPLGDVTNEQVASEP